MQTNWDFCKQQTATIVLTQQVEQGVKFAAQQVDGLFRTITKITLHTVPEKWWHVWDCNTRHWTG